MLGLIKIKEFGATPRRLAKAMREAQAEEWHILARTFHRDMRAKRFTVEHGKKAGYRKRSGEDLPFGTKAFWKSYVGQKLKRKGTRDPLVFSGETRARAERMVTIAANSKGVKLRYSLNVLNYIPWARAEFSKILPEEANLLAQQYEINLTNRLNRMK